MPQMLPALRSLQLGSSSSGRRTPRSQHCMEYPVILGKCISCSSNMIINYLGCKVSIACPRDGALFHLASALIYWYDSGWFINCWYRCCCCWRLGRVCQQLINSLPISWWRKTESGYSFVLASWQLDIYGCLHWELYSLRGLGHLILGPIVPLTSFFF